jgi:hypothetical protein
MISPETETNLWLADSENGRGRYFRIMGLLPLFFFLAQGAHYWRINELGHMLWICNIGNLLLAIGLFLNHAALIRIVALWTIPGLIIWLIYVVLAWGVFFSSTLAHVGGLIVAMLALRRVGMDRGTWIYALAGYLMIQLASRFFTPVALNVNVAHSVYEGWHTTFDSYWKFWIVATLIAMIILWGVSVLLRRLWPSEAIVDLTPAVVKRA